MSRVEASHERGSNGRGQEEGPSGPSAYHQMTLHSSKRISTTVDSRSFFKTARPLHLKSVLMLGRNVCP